MVTATQISRRVLAGLLVARLEGISTDDAPVTIYSGAVPGQPPVQHGSGGTPDPEGRVAPYVAFFGGGGNPSIEPAVARTEVELAWSFQTTCVAGHHDTVLDLVDRVHDRLYRWVPTAAGHVFSRCVPPLGFDPGTVRVDRNVTPHRSFVPLLWRIDVIR